MVDSNHRKRGKISTRGIKLRPPVVVFERLLDMPSQPDLETIYKWWGALKGTQSFMPTVELARLATRSFQSQLIFTEVLGDERDFLGLQCGSQWTRVSGVDMTNQYLSGYGNVRLQQKLRTVFHRVIDGCKPLVFTTGLEHPSERRRKSELMFLPLTSAAGKVTHLMSVLERRPSSV